MAWSWSKLLVNMGRIDTKQLVLTLARAGAIATLSVKYSARIPRGLKWFFVFLIALNIRGFPILWHCESIWLQ